MNGYISLDRFKASANVLDTTRDSFFLDLIEAASRAVDVHCGRHFFLSSETRYFTPRESDGVAIDDAFSIESVHGDVCEDNTFSEVWTGSQYNKWPRTGPTMQLKFNALSPSRPRNICDYFQIAGVWGYATSAAWFALANTATVATVGGTSVEVSSLAGIESGNTILVESEQMFVRSTSTSGAPVKNYLSVERGVNGTTAAAHSAKAVSVMQYPGLVVAATMHKAKAMLAQINCAGCDEKSIGNVKQILATADKLAAIDAQILGGLTRVVH